jgi:5'-methylthioadenosine/S-adenosylhomocysteine nucleosidase
LGRAGLVAVHREILPLLERFQEEGQERYGEAVLRTGSIGGRPVALAEVPVGPVNAALGAQALIARYRVASLIGFGSAGALDDGLRAGDLVIAQRAIAHDAGRFLGRRFEATGIMGRDGRGQIGFRRAFDADPALVASAEAAARLLGAQARSGTVVTGNQSIFSTARKRWLRQTFGALAVEMETAAVAQTAVAHSLPWLAVRGISDTASDELILDYGRLQVCLDEGRPRWRQQVGRWMYLLAHPGAWRRLRRLHSGLALASVQASRLVEAMLQG